jgi:hypothetical protein
MPILCLEELGTVCQYGLAWHSEARFACFYICLKITSHYDLPRGVACVLTLTSLSGVQHRPRGDTRKDAGRRFTGVVYSGPDTRRHLAGIVSDRVSRLVFTLLRIFSSIRMTGVATPGVSLPASCTASESFSSLDSEPCVWMGASRILRQHKLRLSVALITSTNYCCRSFLPPVIHFAPSVHQFTTALSSYICTLHNGKLSSKSG